MTWSHLALGSSQGKRMHKHYVCQRQPGTSPAFAKCSVNEVLINLLCRELMCYKVAKLRYICMVPLILVNLNNNGALR